MSLKNVAGHLCQLYKRPIVQVATKRSLCSDESLLASISGAMLANRPVDYTSELHFHNAQSDKAMPIFRILDTDGKIVNPKWSNAMDDERALKIYQKILFSRSLDEVLYNSQRQGRISFYLTSYGEEASTIASAAALQSEDLIFAQYRESGPLLWRDYPLQSLVDQCVGNEDDSASGRQMPVHYGSRDLNYVTISSPLATQMPQAVGSAYASKLRKESRIVVCYFGDGAASEGDCHAAFNFAATLRCPVVFFCRNNAYAISTAAQQQYRGDGIACRGAAYGLTSIRIDGNDPFAVYNSVLEARQLALNCQPVLIEAITYRVGHHSTSDDSSAYRQKSEVEYWQSHNCPLNRLRNYLLANSLTSQQEEDALKKKYLEDVIAALGRAERKPKPSVDTLFADVYDELTPRLLGQREELKSLA